MSNPLISLPQKWAKTLASPAMSVYILSYLFFLVILTTVLQVYWGIFVAKKMVMDAWWIWMPIQGHVLPLLPGGWLVGTLLLVSLSMALLTRIPFTVAKMGLWIVHFGGILLVLGAGLSSGLGQEAQLVLEEGQSKNYAQMAHVTELAVQVSTPKGVKEVMFTEPLFLKDNTILKQPELPFEIKVIKSYSNSKMIASEAEKRAAEPNLATAGMGTGVMIISQKPVNRDDYRNDPAAYVELLVEGQPMGRYLLANFIESGQMVTIKDSVYILAIRPKRLYLPIDVALADFEHKQYPGTTIPSWFSSKVMIFNPTTNEKREVTISMNHPLRYDGKTFYQASFGKNDTQSILQVVDNPTWLMPYFSCALIGLGLILHFFMAFNRAGRGDN